MIYMRIVKNKMCNVCQIHLIIGSAGQICDLFNLPLTFQAIMHTKMSYVASNPMYTLLCILKVWYYEIRDFFLVNLGPL